MNDDNEESSTEPGDEGEPEEESEAGEAAGEAKRERSTPRDASRDSPRHAGRDKNKPKRPLSSDAVWREALSELGVDLESDEGWREREGARESERESERAWKRDALGELRGDARDAVGGEMEGRTNWMGEAEVSIEKLYELFDAAYMECELDEDGDLRVVTDSGPRVFLSLHEPNKLLRFMAFYKFRDEAGEYDKLLFVNTLNDDIVFIRFSLNGMDTLIADYYLPYARGASPFHIINAAKLMGRVITSGIRQHDTNNLLE
jgi:hypothetical protein